MRRPNHPLPGTAADGTERALAGVRVCRVGHFSAGYARNRIVAEALRQAGADVVDLPDDRVFPVRSAAIVRRGLARRFDLILVGYPGHSDVPAAAAVARIKGVPLVFDAFVSLFDTFVTDRRRLPSGGLRARTVALVDQVACRLPDRVLLDTEAHIDYFVRRFGLPRDRFRRVWAGADDRVMSPIPRTGDGTFSVFLYGSFVPLQGVEHVIRAAHLLESGGVEARFTVAGEGQTYRAVRRLADELEVRSIQFLGWRPYADLPGLMGQSDVCLGIFGTTPKAGRVIPNKVFDGLAMGRAVVTADTAAAREGLEHGRNAWLCPPGDPEALAGALAHLAGNPDLRRRLGEAGRRRFEEAFSTEAISRDLSGVVRELWG
jgi:glycosyltransferase involved in cell wall biosynthesis